MLCLWVEATAVGSISLLNAETQDGDNRWSMGPIYSVHNFHLLTHMFIHEYATTLDPDKTMNLAEQPMKEARPK